MPCCILRDDLSCLRGTGTTYTATTYTATRTPQPATSCTTPGEADCHWDAFKVPLGSAALGSSAATCPTQHQTIHFTPDTPTYHAIVAAAIQHIKDGSNGTAYTHAEPFPEASEEAIVTAYRAATANALGSSDVPAQACFIGVVFTTATSFTIRLPYTPGGYVLARPPEAQHCARMRGQPPP